MSRFLALAPVFTSLFWVAAIVLTQAGYCKPPHADEGTPAHLFQITMIAQVALMAAFVIAKRATSIGQILPTLALQAAAWSVAALTANFLT